MTAAPADIRTIDELLQHIRKQLEGQAALRGLTLPGVVVLAPTATGQVLLSFAGHFTCMQASMLEHAAPDLLQQWHAQLHRSQGGSPIDHRVAPRRTH